MTTSRRNGGVTKQMKIQITAKKIRLARVAIALVAISLAVCVKNVSTGGQSYIAATATTPAPVFPAGTTVTYSADGGTATSSTIASSGVSLLTITVAAGQTTGTITFTTTVA